MVHYSTNTARVGRVRAATTAILLPLLALITALPACSPGARDTVVELTFALAEAPNAAARNVQYYVYDLELNDAEGRSHPLKLPADPPWQSTRIALIDLAADGAPPRRDVVHGTVDAPRDLRFTGIRFTVGVPFDLNHANPLTAEPPLDRGELFWTWQTGYKFLRADLVVDGREQSFHLGSTGCSSASALRPPAQECAEPNRIRVALEGDPTRGVLLFALAPLATATPSGVASACTGDYLHNPACSSGYSSTGLDPTTGACPGGACATQTLWMLVE
jgi:uncharacterized repeat protein (TIGR04052 family)